jgi:hypothetical protein
LQKLRAYGLSDSYSSWLHSYITNRYPVVRIHGIYSIPFEVLSGVPQGSVLGPLLFNIFVNDLCNVIKHSRYLSCADDIKIYCAVSCVTDCTLLQSDIDSICGWCVTNCMKLNYDKTKVITFTRKTNAIKYNNLLDDKCIARTDSIKDLGVLLDSKLLFHHHVHYVFSQSLKMLGIIRTMTFSFSAFDSFYSCM